MRIWTRDEYERFASQVDKSSMKLALDILFYNGIRSGELLALTLADILPDRCLAITKNYAKIQGEELFLEPGDRIFYFTKSAKTTLDAYSHLYPDKDTRLARKLSKLRRPEGLESGSESEKTEKIRLETVEDM